MSRPAERAPDVILDVDYENGAFVLVLVNIGGDLACEVKVKFGRKLAGIAGQRAVSEAGVFRKLAYLRPGKAIRVFLDSAPLLFARRKRNAFRADVRYRDRTGNEYAQTFIHDLDVYRDLPEMRGVASPLREHP